MLRHTLPRFLLLAFPLLLLAMAAFAFVVDVLGLTPEAAQLASSGLLRRPALPGAWVLGAWALESLGLIALFLLAEGRTGALWLDGLAAAWVAWLFRGPVMVLAVVRAARVPKEPWWSLSLSALVLYSLCGLLLAGVARATLARTESAA